MFIRKLLHSTGAAALVIGLMAATPVMAQEAEPTGIAGMAAASEPPAFDTPEAALDAFKKALEADGGGKVADVLGLDPAKIRGDDSTAAALALIKEGAEKQLSLEGEGDRRTVLIGEKLWPLPFPIVKWEDGKWAFDTYAGLQEIVNRIVGENELQTIATLRAYVDAQEEYASEDRDGDGVEEFAQKLVSTEGTTDGLYWPADEVNGESPAGDLDQSELEDAARGEGYFGYKYKILTGQGDNIAGGAYDYIINGNMIAGYGLIAWPAKYGESGVHTFVVNQHGIVYETDLGPATGDIVNYIDRFNPDDKWTVVSD
ncbi:MAG: DUF2950 family protein [Rhizobiaceae bacterium]|nr:DUF2950 family protein [Rhizobiaceae bacterium]